MSTSVQALVLFSRQWIVATQQENYVWFNNVMVTCTVFHGTPWHLCVSHFSQKSKKGPFLDTSDRSSRWAKQSTVKAAPFLFVVLKSATEKCTVERNITNLDWKIQANKHYSSISTLISSLWKASCIWPKYHFSISNISVKLLPWYLMLLNGLFEVT